METSKAIEALRALSQETRLAVFRAMVKAGPEGMAAGALAAMAGVPGSTLSAHLRILEGAGLIGARRQSRHIIYAADYGQARGLIDFLLEDCCAGHPEICGTASVAMA